MRDIQASIEKANGTAPTIRASHVQYFITMQALSGITDVVNEAITKLTMKGCSLFSLETELTPLLQPKLILTGVDSNGFTEGTENTLDSQAKGGTIG